MQSDSSWIRELGVETIAPILRRGVLLDIAAQMKLDALPTDFAITPGHLDAALQNSENHHPARRRGIAAYRLGALLHQHRAIRHWRPEDMLSLDRAPRSMARAG